MLLEGNILLLGIEEMMQDFQKDRRYARYSDR